MTPKPQTFGEAVRLARGKVSLRTYSEATGVPLVTLHGIERGAMPQARTIAALARATGMSLAKCFRLLGLA